MELWQQMIRDSVHTVDQLVEKFNIDRKMAEDLDEFFQARINPYYLQLNPLSGRSDLAVNVYRIKLNWKTLMQKKIL